MLFCKENLGAHKGEGGKSMRPPPPPWRINIKKLFGGFFVHTCMWIFFFLMGPVSLCVRSFCSMWGPVFSMWWPFHLYGGLFHHVGVAFFFLILWGGGGGLIFGVCPHLQKLCRCP